MDNQKKFKRVGTHHGRFHADEVMATAILKEIFEIELTRTRDTKVLQSLDIVYDVGGGEFDHHDTEKKYREDGIPFASCGLIWHKFGRDVVRLKDPSLSEQDVESIFNYVDRVLIKGIDALDNGIRPDDDCMPIMTISSIISGFNPPWYLEKSEDEAFYEAVELVIKVLRNTINNKFSAIKAKEIVIETFENRPMPEVMVLDVFCPWGETLRDIDEKEEVLFVIYKSKENYAMQTVRGRDYEDRKPFPKAWAGKRDEDLACVTGVEDSVFCHTGRFITIARTFEGIMKLAQLAINEPEEREERGFLEFIKQLFLRR